jgi:hypothetical protein
MPRPHSLHHWLQFMRTNEASFSSSMLMACWMATSRDRQEAAAIQYVVGFVASGVSLLIPLDALGMALQVRGAPLPATHARIRTQGNEEWC